MISEDWSSDCRRDVPVLARLAEAGGIELRIFNRDGKKILGTRRPDPAAAPDANHDLMLEFMNGKSGAEWASVPVVVVYTTDFRELHRYIEFPAIYHKDLIRGTFQAARPGETERADAGALGAGVRRAAGLALLRRLGLGGDRRDPERAPRKAGARRRLTSANRDPSGKGATTKAAPHFGGALAARVRGRRTFLRLVTGSLLAAPLASEAQPLPSPVRIGFLPLGLPSSAYDRSLVEAFRQGLRDVGLIENEHIVLDIAWAGSQPEIAGAVAELLERGAKLLVTCGTSNSLGRSARRRGCRSCSSASATPSASDLSKASRLRGSTSPDSAISLRS